MPEAVDTVEASFVIATAALESADSAMKRMSRQGGFPYFCIDQSSYNGY